jgi:hypothetical protein
MATSGTYSFDPSNGELVLFAYALCGIRRTELLAQHMADARMALNLLFSTWGNDTPNLWTVDLVSLTLVSGQATYDVDPSTIMVLDAYIRTNAGTTSQVDRIIWPVSRTEYASFPNKTFQAPPTVFWFDRLTSPTITLWQTPDDQQVYSLQYYRCTALQDANMPDGETPAIPPRWLMATAYGLAEVLATSYAPDRLPIIAPKAAQYLLAAQEQDTENVPLILSPMTNTYWTR